MTKKNPYQAPNADCHAIEADRLCPNCGNTLEKGIIQSFGNITWYPEMTSFKRSVPQRLSPKGINIESKIPAIKCSNCNCITVDIPDDVT